MVIGLDFDNTIVDYGAIFREIAVESGFVPAGFRGSKRQLRDLLRAQPSGEERWQRVQAQAYGPRLADAEAFAGAQPFVARCRELGIPLFVVSHKSTYAAAEPGGTDLRSAASAWLERHFGRNAFDAVFFEDTRAEKIARITALGCTHAIDDLPEVFADPTFPSNVARWLFDPDGRMEGGGFEAFASWAALLERTEEERALGGRIAALIGREPAFVLPCRGGANNRVYRVEALDGSEYAVKSYGAGDDRGRLRHEFGALEFLTRHGVTVVPAPVASDAEHGLAAYEWIAGERAGAPSAADLGAATAFLAQVDGLRDSQGAAALPPAADAATSAAELWRQIDERYVRLQEIAAAEPALAEYLERFAEAAERLRSGPSGPHGEALERARQTLSPSDFGFHNALRRGESLVFLDFEYFGWDDPVKLAADFVLHPGMNLTSADTKEWLSGLTAVYGRDPDFSARLARLYPVLALKWCLIILNEFLPAAWARRVASGRHRLAAPAKAEQLAKAAARLERIVRGESIDGSCN
jgi:hypothetical protein